MNRKTVALLLGLAFAAPFLVAQNPVTTEWSASTSLNQDEPNVLGTVDDSEPHQGFIWNHTANTPMETQATWTCKQGGDAAPNASMACGFGYNHSADGNMGGPAESSQEQRQNFVFENHINKSGTVQYRGQFKTSFRAAKSSCILDDPVPDATWTTRKYIKFERAGELVGYGIVMDYDAGTRKLTWNGVNGGPVAEDDTADEVDDDGTDGSNAANGTCGAITNEDDYKVQWWETTQYPDYDAVGIVVKSTHSTAGGKYNFYAYGGTDEVVMQCTTAALPGGNSGVRICDEVQLEDGIKLYNDATHYCVIEHDGTDLNVDCTTAGVDAVQMEVDVPVKAKLVHQIGAAPDATCIAGEVFIDTDETDDTNCTTTSDNSLCLCVATDTWVELDNN